MSACGQSRCIPSQIDTLEKHIWQNYIRDESPWIATNFDQNLSLLHFNKGSFDIFDFTLFNF